MMLDTRGANGSGVLLGLVPDRNSSSPDRSARPYFYPSSGWNGLNGLSPLNVTEGRWSFIGVSVVQTREQSTFTFSVNGKRSPELTMKRPAAGHFTGEVCKLARFLGSLRAVGLFREALPLEHMNAWANQFGASVGASDLLPAANRAPVPALQMDAANEQAVAADWVSSNDGGPAESVSALQGGRLLRICGQASAGVDIDALTGEPAETFRVAFDFRASLAANATRQIVLTVGDAQRHLLVAFEGGRISLTTVQPSGQETAFSVAAQPGWHQVVAEIGTTSGATSVALDAGPPRKLALGPLQSIWCYLGQGYRTADVYQSSASPSPATCAEINVTSLRTSVRAG